MKLIFVWNVVWVDIVFTIFFLLFGWNLCKLNQTTDQCEKPGGKKKKTLGHAYIWDMQCLVFSYFTSENMKITNLLVFGKMLLSI